MHEAHRIAAARQRASRGAEQAALQVGQADDAAVNGEVNPVGAAAVAAIGQAEGDFDRR